MTPWSVAHERQQAALAMANLMMTPRASKAFSNQQGNTWHSEQYILQTASPFVWGAESSEAVRQASAQVPTDTPFTAENLPTQTAWWYFERTFKLDVALLNYETSQFEDRHVRAISMGWLGDQTQFSLSVWYEDNQVGLTAGDMWFWRRGETMSEMLDRLKAEHREVYGPGGVWHDMPHKSEEKFAENAGIVSKFVLAGLAWLGQSILQTRTEPVERHLRKSYEREHGRRPLDVKVVHLRKVHREHGDATGEPSPVDWSCRWMVGGHWRNQPVGPGRKETRLTWIAPFMKGPEGKPLVVKSKTVFMVNR